MKDQQVSTMAMYQVKLIVQGLRTNNNSIQNFSLVWYIGLERLLLKVAAIALKCCREKNTRQECLLHHLHLSLNVHLSHLLSPLSGVQSLPSVARVPKESKLNLSQNSIHKTNFGEIYCVWKGRVRQKLRKFATDSQNRTIFSNQLHYAAIMKV